MVKRDKSIYFRAQLFARENGWKYDIGNETGSVDINAKQYPNKSTGLGGRFGFPISTQTHISQLTSKSGRVGWYVSSIA